MRQEKSDIMLALKSCFRGLSAVCISLLMLSPFLGCSEKKVILRNGQRAPAFTLTDTSGKTIRVPEDVRGKVVAIRFWASTCKYCAAEMPEMEEVYKKYADKGLIILAVNIGEERGTVERFAKEHNISYPLLVDPGQEVTKRYGVISVPVTVILDRDGIIRQKILGGINGQTLEEIMMEWLKGKKS